MITTDSPRVKGSSPVRGKFFAEKVLLLNIKIYQNFVLHVSDLSRVAHGYDR